MKLPLPSWKLPGHLEEFCLEHWNPRAPVKRPHFTIDELRAALFKLENIRQSYITNYSELTTRFACANALFFCSHRPVSYIMPIVEASSPAILKMIVQLRPVLLDPHISIKTLMEQRKTILQPALLGLTIREAAHALGIRYNLLREYIKNPYSLEGGRHGHDRGKRFLDQIFIDRNPPLELLEAARKKKLHRQAKHLSQLNKFAMRELNAT